MAGDARLGQRRQQPLGEMQAGGGRRHRSRLAGVDGLVVAPVLVVLAAPGGDVGRQRHQAVILDGQIQVRAGQVEGLVGERHEPGPDLLHLLGHHLDFPLRERGVPRSLARGPQGQEVHQRAGVHRDVHGGVRGQREHAPGHFPGHPRGQHLQVSGVRLAAGTLGGRGRDRVLLRRAVHERVGARLADLDEPALGARPVEDRPEAAVARALLVVGGDPVPHELAEHEDRRLDEVGHRVVLERRSVPVPHQVADEADGTGRVSADVLAGLLALGGDRHVVAEPDLARLVVGHGRL